MKITHTTLPFGMLNIGQTPKFKTIRIQVVCHNDMAIETVSKRAVLPYLMRSISTKYPTRIALQTKLEEMYAASFSGSVRSIGLTQEIAFDLHIIHDDYAIASTNLLEEAFAFLHDILFQPKFDQAIFQEEVRLIDEYFLSVYGDKMRYALKQLTKHMYEGNQYALDALGDPESLQQLTLSDCIDAYQTMMREDAININVVGNVTEADILPYITQFLPFAPRAFTRTVIDRTHRDIDTPNHIVETQDITQGKLAIGYQLPAYYQTDDYHPAIVMNAVLGAGPDSLLFKRVREELNKVYFIGSMYDQYKGSLAIYAGIDPKDYDDVIHEINLQIKAIQTKTIDPNVFEIAKTTIIQHLIESLDSIGSIVARINHLAMFHKTFQQAELIQRIKGITLDDIARIANMMQLDTTFFLKGDNHENTTI